MRVRPPQLPADLPWLNVAEPLSLRSLNGRPVLLEFWTQGCINCQHMVPILHQLEQHYGPKLVIIGIHSAKFDAEQSPESVQQAVMQFGITHPVVVDEDRKLWDAYAVRAWPTLVFIDAWGYIVRQTSGERSVEQLRSLIDSLVSSSAYPNQTEEIRLPPAPACPAPDGPPVTPLRFPGKILVTGSQLFIADTGHHRIVVTDLAGQIQSVIGAGIAGLQDGDFGTAQFTQPQGLAWDAQMRTLYVADAGNHAIRAVDVAQGHVQTIAGNGTQSRAIFPHGGMGIALSLNSPWDLARVGQQLYIAMAGMHQIWVMDLDSQQLETYIGTGAEGCVDGDRTVAAFAQPSGLATDGTHLYVADSETSSIRKVTPGITPTVTTLCGSGALFDYGDKDGVGDTVRLQHPMGIAVQHGDAVATAQPETPLLVYIADTYNHKVKRLSVDGCCSTVMAELHRPTGIACHQNSLFIADTNGHRVMIQPLTSQGKYPIRNLQPLHISGLA